MGQCDENTTFSNHALYLGLPCCKDDFNGCPNIPSSLIFQRSTKETLWISTQLSSTKLTQNGNLLTLANNFPSFIILFSEDNNTFLSCLCCEVDLLALLKWKAHPERVMDILGRLRHVCGEEIVKVRALSCFLSFKNNRFLCLLNAIYIHFLFFFSSFFKTSSTRCSPFWMTTQTNMDPWCFSHWLETLRNGISRTTP